MSVARKVIDWNLSVKLAAGNAELAEELLTALVADLDDSKNAILSAYQNNDNEKLRQEAHKLYGVCCYCGVPQLRASVGEIEASLKSETISNLSELIKEFETACHNVAQALEEKNYQSA